MEKAQQDESMGIAVGKDVGVDGHQNEEMEKNRKVYCAVRAAMDGVHRQKYTYRCCIYCLDLPGAQCGPKCPAKEIYKDAYKSIQEGEGASLWSSEASREGCSLYCVQLEEARCDSHCNAFAKLDFLDEEESKFLRKKDADRYRKTIQMNKAIAERERIEDLQWERKLAAYYAEAYPPLPDGVEYCDLTLAQRRARGWHANSIKHP